MKIALVLSVVLLLTQTHGDQIFKSDPKLAKFKEECAKANNVDKKITESVDSGDFADSATFERPNVKCYVNCLLERFRFSPNSAPSQSNINELFSFASQDGILEITTKCWKNSRAKTEQCDSSFDMFKCIVEKSKGAGNGNSSNNQDGNSQNKLKNGAGGKPAENEAAKSEGNKGADKSEDQKGTDAKAVDSKGTDAKAEDSKGTDANAEDNKGTADKPVDNKGNGGKPEDVGKVEDGKGSEGNGSNGTGQNGEQGGQNAGMNESGGMGQNSGMGQNGQMGQSSSMGQNGQMGQNSSMGQNGPMGQNGNMDQIQNGNNPMNQTQTKSVLSGNQNMGKPYAIIHNSRSLVKNSGYKVQEAELEED